MTEHSSFVWSTELLERLPAAVATFDYATGDALMLNRRFTEEYGYSLGDIPNIRLWWYQMFIDPETSEEIKEHWDHLQAGGEIPAVTSDGSSESFEVRGTLHCKDGSDKHVELRVVFIGRIMVISVTNITNEVVMIKELEKTRYTDEDTGFRNHKGFNEVFLHQMERARRYHEPLGLIVMRLDNRLFSETADRSLQISALGHMGQHITSAVRNCDLIGRTGPMEISILLPSTPALGAAVVAERIVARIRKTAFAYEGTALALEIRIGVAATDDGIQTVDHLTQAALEALNQMEDAELKRRG